MAEISKQKPIFTLLVGDAVVLVAGTLIGFASHGELTSGGLRMLTTLLPMSAAWFAAALPLQLFASAVTTQGKELWRVWTACLFAAPLAGVLRALWLGSTVLPVFVVVMFLSFGALFFGWRVLFWYWQKKTLTHG